MDRVIECGAVYENLTIPPDAVAIEETLVQRPDKYRHYDPTRGDTVDTLKQENINAGLPPDQHGKPPEPPGKPNIWMTPWGTVPPDESR